MPPGSIRSLFRDYGGHHIFPLAEALLRGNLLTPDAIDVLSKNTIGSDGQLKDQQDPANPHRGFNKAQREYGQAVHEVTDRFIKQNGIDRNNPMTGEQAQRLAKALETSSDTRISGYLESLKQYIYTDRSTGRPRVRGIGRGSRGQE